MNYKDIELTKQKKKELKELQKIILKRINKKGESKKWKKSYY